jgi:hypothetical protein
VGNNLSGLTVLGVTLIYGAEYTTNIPQEMGKGVTIAMGVQGSASYMWDLTTAGLRGTIIEWNDGLFRSLSRAYPEIRFFWEMS